MTEQSTATLQYLPIELLAASTTNPRQHFDRAGLDELKASIHESGVQVPLLVRPRRPESGAEGVYAPNEPEYEVVAGSRRFRVAGELELATVPCLVRDLTDDEARDAQIVENLQRADVHPLDEAEAFEELLHRLGSIPAVAARLGKEQAYVAKCLRLRALTLHSSDALRAGIITIEHALLLARLAEAEQNEALKWTVDHEAGSKKPVEKVVAERIAIVKEDADGKPKGYHRYIWEPQSVAKLKAHIEVGSGVKLSRAPWDTQEDDLLPDVPSCVDCPKNTKANAPLFGDLDIDDPTCTDGACFAAKTSAFVQIALAMAGHDPKGGTNGAVPRLSWKSSSVKPSIVTMGVPAAGSGVAEKWQANPAKVLKYGQWIDAKKGSCANVRPGVTVDWSDAGDRGHMGDGSKLRKPGEVVQVCIAVGCKVHPKGWEKQAVGNGKHAKHPDVAAEERCRAETAHFAEIEPKIRAKVFEVVVTAISPAQALLQVANADRDHAAVRAEMHKRFPQLNGIGLEAMVVFVSQFRDSSIDANEYYMARQKDGVAVDRERLWKLAKAAGVDADQVAAKFFHDEGSIAPLSDKLYPKGVPWPKDLKAAGAAAVKSAAKKAVAKKPVTGKPVAAKAVAKKAAKKAVAKPVAAKARTSAPAKKAAAKKAVKK